jgi:hypothetical protein
VTLIVGGLGLVVAAVGLLAREGGRRPLA